jgi:hypothetical protein
MIEVVKDASRIPPGSHALSLFVTQEEAAARAADFLAGAPREQEAAYWLADDRLLPMYLEAVEQRAPERLPALRVLTGSQVEWVGPELRPVEEVAEFVLEHPDGVTGAGETLTWYWTPEEVPAYLEYEQWFHEQARGASRFLCPYNLRDVPPEDAPAILRALGARHSHVILSSSLGTTARVLQLFVFPTARDLPGTLRADLDWAVGEGFVTVAADTMEMALTPAGEELLVDWPS